MSFRNRTRTEEIARLTREYYIRIRGTVRGPFPPDKLKELARRGQFSRVYHVSADGVNWEPAAKHPELLPEAKAVKIRKQAAQSELANSAYELAEFDEPAATSPAGEERVATSGGRREPAVDVSWQNNTTWYYAHAGREVGPLSFAELKHAVLRGDLTYNDCVWTEGMSDWMDVLSVPGLLTEADYAKVASAPSGGHGREAGGSAASPMAVASLVCGILGLLVCPGVFSVAAVICGHLAPKPSGLATAGLVMGYIAIALIVGLVILGVLGIVLEGAA